MAGNHVIQRRTGGPFSRLLASRSPVPADHRRYPTLRMTLQRISRLVLIFATLAVLTACSGVPLISPNREGFPPWEKILDGNGITWINKYTHDPGIDPLYLGSFRYDDDDALQRVIDTFGLEPYSGDDEVPTFTGTVPDPVPWFPLQNVDSIYSYPDADVEYVANVWVDAEQNVAIIERTWW
ncbi:hypothetical protein CA13_00770 [Planctomycetes bacterium CA13]|uniref:Uncharacterized protein n=2 Tax=Novipirellula herctigrandis TaxID=2527986 RepID=A0A5C5YV35_9BACT|nr:hypothetical protein CA13_00770 [Planctomycetes bacterium CA13]